ncbi:MAG: hypothetical protein QGG54_01625 [Gammaproteobacteria bacterium]|nr:hypothetical protein [Gammaproteobacteria bacterium]MDP6534990.1 hypothetical protein [Gammaproteobacteria bacterium]MDP6734521.1 hypothetical protein [Gammaproteobacteria bacterium]HAJ76961.1 hypothetical protein [Gammaproteobacteria bacterium]
MTRLPGMTVIMTISALLIGCEIEPVSVGTWEIEVTTDSGLQSSVWTITADANITVSADTERDLNEVVLAGSRITWSAELPNPDDPSLGLLNMNFRGTVDGNTLQGTLFSTLGNFSVAGTRQ